MIGLLLNDIDRKELHYLLKRELEELRFDLEDRKLDSMVRKAVKDRYHVLFQIFRRMATEKEYIRYLPKEVNPD